MKPKNAKDSADLDDTSHDIPPSSLSLISGNKMKTIATDIGQLPSEMLDVISKKLDVDDLYSFGGVCHQWRTSFKTLWAQFMASDQALLVVEARQHYERDISFLSIFDEKSYSTSRLPKIGTPSFTSWYEGNTNGYLVIKSKVDNSLVFLNPFLRTMKKIPCRPPKSDGPIWDYLHSRPIFTFASVVDSKDFVIVSHLEKGGPIYVHGAGFTTNLMVYQSRNSSWENYSSTSEYFRNVVDIAVLNKTLYALAFTGKIGILSLNSPKVTTLNLNMAPMLRCCGAKLVSSEGQLLVVEFSEKVKRFNIFKIDFSMMRWVKLENLGDRALFWRYPRYHALSNPDKWGYEDNFVYIIESMTLTCHVYSMTNGCIRSILLVKNQPPSCSIINNQNPYTLDFLVKNQPPSCSSSIYNQNPYMLDWYFQHIRDEVNYSTGA